MWEKYSSREMGDVVDVQELANWALRLHPRSVQDFKPLFILLQGILKELLSGQMTTFSGSCWSSRTGSRRCPASAGSC